LAAVCCWAGRIARPDDAGADGRFVHHPDIAIHLWAAEPLVVDPVALSFAANGDCYVVEMRDYPYGIGPDRRPGGTIRRLRDTDGDGRADEAVVFAEDLSFPTSVLAWREGVLLCAPPHVLFLADTDGDGRADRRETVVEGLDLGVTDSNANSLRFGIDGMIHAANGGNGGRVRCAGTGGEPLDLRGADFAFSPDTREIRRTYRTGGGFGLVDDAAGHSFTTYNLDHLQERIVPIGQDERAIDVEPVAGTASISDHGESARLFPVSTAATRPNHPEQAGRFSAAGGMGFIDGLPFSPRLARSVLVCDVVCNVIHRDLLVEDGPVFRGTRAAEESATEFIAARDPACRPVGLEPGPAGALYLIDMQRDTIEHPDYIPKSVLAKLDVRAGSDRGRIYRVVPRDGLPARFERLDRAAPETLVGELSASGRWRRDTAHRLLVSEHPQAATGALQAAAASATLPEARLRAWRILAATGRLADGDVRRAAADPHEDVRETAVALAANAAQRHADCLVELLDDEHARVRFAAALVLDGIEASGKAAALGRMLARDMRHAWSVRAVALAADDHAPRLLAAAWEMADEGGETGQSGAGRPQAIRALAFASAAGDAAARRADLAAWLDRVDWHGAAPTAAAALADGLAAGWRRRPESIPAAESLAAALARWAEARLPGTATGLLDLATLRDLGIPPALADTIAAARDQIARPTRSETIGEKVAAIDLLARTPGEEAVQPLLDLLVAPEPGEVQRAAVEALRQRRVADLAQRLVVAWPRLAPAIRPAVVGLLVSDRRSRESLLEALESGSVRLGELNLDLEQRRAMLRWTDPAVAARAAALFTDDEYGDRKAIVGEWLARLPAEGDAESGREMFRARCATCHAARGVGHRVGPDLEALSHRSVEDLATHVLDPNMAINPGYVSCVVETSDGRAYTGLLSGETADAVTVLQPEGKGITIPRREIDEFRTLATSLMPEGLEKEMTPQQLRDLIAFLQQR
jgi:putative membrane-bound dehydrogenase-like protein